MGSNAIIYIGSFGNQINSLGGQEEKTRIIWSIFKENYQTKINKIDITNWKSSPFSTLLHCVFGVLKHRYVFLVLGRNSLKKLLPILLFFKKKRTKFIYYVIGGWLPFDLMKNKHLAKCVRKCDTLFVQTKRMQTLLSELSINQTVYTPSFSSRQYVNFDDIKPYSTTEYIDFFTLSRVCREKGICEAIKSIKTINKNTHYKCRLFIYGNIEESFRDEFFELIKDNEKFIYYKGFFNSTNLLELTKYFCCLFPTKHDGEGFPTSILESFMAGVPVIASNWMYNSELITNYINGFLYNLDEEDGLYNIILKTIECKQMYFEMRVSSYNYSLNYSKDSVSKILLSAFKGI